MRRRISIVEQNPQPGPKPPIPGCVVSLKFSQQSASVARYETMALPRPIEIKAGRVTIFARPGVHAVASALTMAPPTPGRISDGGDDESFPEILSLTPHAHTVAVESGIGGKYKLATFSDTGSNLKLMALNGAWHVVGICGVKLK